MWVNECENRINVVNLLYLNLLDLAGCEKLLKSTYTAVFFLDEI